MSRHRHIRQDSGRRPGSIRGPKRPSRLVTAFLVLLVAPAVAGFAQINAEGKARNFEYLRGKTASYRLNAYVDYRIATQIMQFVESGVEPAGTHEAAVRARGFMADLARVGSDPEQTQRLTVRAFTLRHLNGYADLMWARFIERVNRVDPVHVEAHYGRKAEEGPIDLFFWTYLLRGSVEPVAAFVEQQLAFTLSDAAVADEIAHVQESNSAANQGIAEELHRAMELAHRAVSPLGAELDFEKSRILLSYAQASPYPTDFLRGAIAAQRGAGRWDGAFRRLLQWRF